MKYDSVKHLFVDRRYSTEISPPAVVIALRVLRSAAVRLTSNARFLAVT